MPFQPGQSGNPAGRPRGARNKTTILFEELFAEDAEAVIRKIIEQAKAGNSGLLLRLAALLLPKRNGAPVQIDLPKLEEPSDAPSAIAAIIAAVCAGELTPDEGKALTRMVEAYVRVTQKTEKRGRSRERQQVENCAAPKTRSPESLAPSPARATKLSRRLEQADVSPQPDEPNVAVPPPALLDVALRWPTAGSLRRLRQDASSSTCSVVQSATSHPPLYPVVIRTRPGPAAAGRIPAAA
jgi:hypothetical protein